MRLPGNCEPRHEAVLREVKKKSPNKGKFFWKCQVYPYCDFFLWRDEAKVREVGLPSSTAPEPDDDDDDDELLAPLPPPSKTPASTQRQITSYGYSRPGQPSTRSSTAQARAADGDEAPTAAAGPGVVGAGPSTPCPGPSKRKRDALEEDEFSDFGSEEEMELVALADNSAQKASMTPSTVRASDVDPASPSVARTLFPGDRTKKQKTVSFEAAESSLPTPGPTPHTSRTTVAASPPPRPDSSSGADDIAAEVMALMRGQEVDRAVMDSVRDALESSARRTKGLVKGRDVAREEIAKKDAKIAELQAALVALKNKVRMHHNQVTSMKADLMKVYQDN